MKPVSTQCHLHDTRATANYFKVEKVHRKKWGKRNHIALFQTVKETQFLTLCMWIGMDGGTCKIQCFLVCHPHRCQRSSSEHNSQSPKNVDVTVLKVPPHTDPANITPTQTVYVRLVMGFWCVKYRQMFTQ